MQHASQLDLSHDVVLYRDDGTTLRTESASIDLKNGAAANAEPVHAEGPFGTLDAQGFTAHRQGRGDPVRRPGASRDERAQPMTRPARGCRFARGLAWRSPAARRARSSSTFRMAARSTSPRATASNGARTRSRSSPAATPAPSAENVTVTADRLIALLPQEGRRTAQRRRRAPPPTGRHRRGRRGHLAATRSTAWRPRATSTSSPPTDHAEGDRAIYDLDQAVLVMTGQEPEADHAAGRAHRAGQPGILVAEAHGGRARRRGRRDQ